MFLLAIIALVIARSCLSPCEKFTPPSKTTSEYWFSSCMINSWAFEILAAAITSSSVAFGLAYFRLFIIVVLNKKVSCKTIEIWFLHECSLTFDDK